MSFPDSKQMTEYKKYLEEAAKRDHRRIGKDQELWTFNELSPGSAFFLPMGMRIYNTLLNFIKVRRAKRCQSRNTADQCRLSTTSGVSPRVSRAVLSIVP